MPTTTLTQEGLHSDANNWSSGVPNLTTSAIIPANMTCALDYTTSMNALSVSFGSGSSIGIPPVGTHRIKVANGNVGLRFTSVGDIQRNNTTSQTLRGR